MEWRRLAANRKVRRMADSIPNQTPRSCDALYPQPKPVPKCSAETLVCKNWGYKGYADILGCLLDRASKLMSSKINAVDISYEISYMRPKLLCLSIVVRNRLSSTLKRMTLNDL